MVFSRSNRRTISQLRCTHGFTITEHLRMCSQPSGIRYGRLMSHLECVSTFGEHAWILPIKKNLQKRGCDIDPICTLCGELEETTNHLFLLCKRSVRCWYTSTLWIDMTKEHALSLQEFVWKKVNGRTTRSG